MCKTETIEVSCPICGSAAKNLLLDVADFAHPDFTERFGVCRCDSCGCGYLSPRPSKNAMHRYYDVAFYWSYEGGSTTPEAVLAARLPQILAKRKLIDDVRPGRLLDIGAMKGEFVYSLRKDGWQAEGSDFSSNALNLFDVPMKYGEFLGLQYEEAAFDCITMWAVLEHVYEPRAYIEKVSRLLKPGGRFVTLVTNFNSIQGRYFRADDYPRHLTMFTKSSLRKLLSSNELEVDRMFTSQDIFGGSLYGALVYAAKRRGGYEPDAIFYEWRNLKDSHSFCCKWRGKESAMMTWVSRVDRFVSLPVEKLLDRLGCGFILTCVAHKRNT
jgi:2-polyprenyl-3-methyl-5-hydroxy-6-metoxy-1,4-benzoquinol methylase